MRGEEGKSKRYIGRLVGRKKWDLRWEKEERKTPVHSCTYTSASDLVMGRLM